MPSYKALYPYEPRAAGELLLLEGEVVTQVVPVRIQPIVLDLCFF